MSNDVRPTGFGGLRHVALYVKRFDACEHFYVDLLGMKVEWRPDPDNLYLSSGCDNLALHRSNAGNDRSIDSSERSESKSNEGDIQGAQKLDHIGFIIDDKDAVDQWHAYLKAHGVVMKTQPVSHRDGARSFYCLDPDGTVVQMIYHPPLAGQRFHKP